MDGHIRRSGPSSTIELIPGEGKSRLRECAVKRSGLAVRVQPDCDRPVIYQRYGHISAELAGLDGNALSGQRICECQIEPLPDLGVRRS